ncbi:hypothetical protein MCHI_002855 [Candidatus Magnetoovum chiemensis]|nr:hypothetical protein MCHI_002855 [Candidatus Magnetoovum chiemensis]
MNLAVKLINLNLTIGRCWSFNLILKIELSLPSLSNWIEPTCLFGGFHCFR